jgi:hypothetical protein
MASTKKTWHQYIPGPVRRDPKQSALLAGLLVVLVGLALRQLATSSSSPASVQAATPHSSSKDAAGKAVRTLSTDHLLAWLGTEIEPVARDVFRIDQASVFGVTPQVRDQKPSAEPEDPAKSVRQEADEQKVRRFDESAVIQAARRLRVQSTMEGASPSALVNGQLVRPGDAMTVDRGVELKVRSVERGRVIFEARGVSVSVGAGGDLQLVETQR